MGKILIDEDRLRRLLAAEFKLNALEAGGVDNWEWYGESFQDDLKYWNSRLAPASNEDNPDEQFDDWEDLQESFVEKNIAAIKEKNV